MPQGSTYEQQAVIEAVSDFYDLLSTLPYVRVEDIIHPPKDGWPTITSEKFAAFGKTDGVVDLLKKILYVHTSSVPIPDLITSHPTKGLLVPTGAEHFPPWTVPLTYAKSRDGRWAILDLTDGTVTEYEIQGSSYEKDYADNDPRAWRNEGRWQEEPTDRMLPVSEWFRRLGDKFRQLEWVGFWRDGAPTLWLGYDFWFSDTERQTTEMRETIKAHGWPSAFDRQACERALSEYVGRNP